MTELQVLAIDSLVPHPDNPRLQLREDVVERIAGEIRRFDFGREHALLVRPKDGAHQILSGHHRVEAAKRAGLNEVPCWVREMDDDEAFMQLVLANTQGELSPLEEGRHVFDYVERGSVGGRGNRGGMSEYARRLGKDEKSFRERRSAYAVYRNLGVNPDLSAASKFTQLVEISKAAHEIQKLLVEIMLAREWTAADTRHHVEQVRAFDIPEQWHFWLPLDKVVAAHLGTREFSPRTVARLVSAATQTDEWIAEHAADPDIARADFQQWLTDGIEGKSWEPRAVAEYLSRLVASQFIVHGWHHGNWREHLPALDDGSVSLILTDPPYGMGFQSDYRLDRRKDRKHEVIASDDENAPDELLEALSSLYPKLADDAHVLVFCGWAAEPDIRDVVAKAGYTLRGSLIWDKQATGMGDPETTFAPAHERILHAVKGSPMLFRRAPDLLSHRRCDSSRHPTEKPVPLLRELIEATTAEGQLVVDPFGGVASVLVAARESQRRWWGCEIEEGYWSLGEERLS